MFWWFFVPACVAGGLLTCKIAANWLYENDDLESTAFLLVPLFVLWPVFIVGYVAWKIIKPEGMKQVEQKEKLKSTQRELERRSKEIERLKKEFDL